MLIKSFILVLLSICRTFALEILNNPFDQYANLYENVIFKCVIKDYNKENDLVEWCKNDFCTWGRSIELKDGRLKFKSLSKHYIIGNRDNGEWNLLIENITVSDVGQYKCTVTRRNDQVVYKINSNPANLKIMQKPTSIDLNHQDSVEIVLDKSESIDCIVENSVPDPTVNWFMINTNTFDKILAKNNFEGKKYLKLVENFNSSYQMNVFTSPNSTHISRLTLNGNMNLLNKTLIAVIEHPLINEPVLKYVKIDLKYPPILSISYEPNEPLEEDKTYTFYCHSNSNNQIKLSKNFYYSNENYKFQNLNGSIKLKLNRRMNGSNLICQEVNSIGKSILNYSLDILYAPKFIDTPEPIVVVKNNIKKFSLNCTVDSNPKPEVYWVKNEDKVVHVGERLSFGNNQINGNYECQARVKGFESISSKVSVISEGPPNIYGKSLFVYEPKKDLSIHFAVLSSPSIQTGPICYKIDKNISSIVKIIYPSHEPEKYILDEDDLNELKMSTRFRLRIKNTNEDDSGFYNCTFSNSFGESFYKFEIKKNVDKINIGVTFTLIICFSILITILILSILILVCVQRKRMRANEIKKALPSVSDHSGYEQSDKLSNQYQIFACEQVTVLGDFSKNLSDDRKIDNSFKKQSNQISLVMDQNSLESLSECVKFPSDTQNLILIDKLKSISQSDKISQGIYNKANIYSSKFQTNV